jgi:hypothetical protein
MEDVAFAEISGIILSESAFEPQKFFKLLLTYINQNQQLSRLFFGGKVSKTFNERITQLLLNSYWDCLCETYKLERDNEQLKYYELFCFAGTLAIIEKWVIGEFTCSKAELIDMLVQIDENWNLFVANQFNNLKS